MMNAKVCVLHFAVHISTRVYFQNDILCCRDSIKDDKHTLAQLHKILYHVSLSYDAFHIRAKEATLALALRLVHLLHHEIREGTLIITGMVLSIIIREDVGHRRLIFNFFFFLYCGGSRFVWSVANYLWTYQICGFMYQMTVILVFTAMGTLDVI
jgi:hypothetical protein